MGFSESFSDQRLSALYSYWVDKRAGRRMPSRADIDPGDLKPLLPHLLLIDVIEGGRDLRYRLVGTEIERHIGQAVTGRLVSEFLSGEYLVYINALHARVIDGAIPAYSENNFGPGGSGFAAITEFKRASRLVLPLSRDGVAVDMLLCAQLFDPIRDPNEPDLLVVDAG